MLTAYVVHFKALLLLSSNKDIELALVKVIRKYDYTLYEEDNVSNLCSIHRAHQF